MKQTPTKSNKPAPYYRLGKDASLKLAPVPLADSRRFFSLNPPSGQSVSTFLDRVKVRLAEVVLSIVVTRMESKVSVKKSGLQLKMIRELKKWLMILKNLC